MMQSATRAIVDLATIRENLAAVQMFVGESVDVMAVLKADAYGHGTARVALAAWKAGIRWFGVATVEEGVQLRSTLPEARICILAPTLSDAAEAIILNQLTPLISDSGSVIGLSDSAARLKQTASVHLDVDTGMGRSGVTPEQVTEAFADIQSAPNVELTGIATHFTSAEWDPAFTDFQISQFRAIAEGLDLSLTAHAANSAGLCLYPEGRFDMVRPGLLVYGIRPAMPPQAPCPAVRPALTLESRVALVRTLDSGASISYDRTCVLYRQSRVATIPVGYGDGYPRELSNRGSVLIAGRRAPILGRVCMDATVVDVTDIPDAATGQKVTLIGMDGDDEVTVNEIATLIGTTLHDVTTRLTPRVPRVYVGE